MRLIEKFNRIKDELGIPAAVEWLQTLTDAEREELARQNIEDFKLFCAALGNQGQMQKARWS